MREEIQARLAQLSPEQRERLLEKLRSVERAPASDGIGAAVHATIPRRASAEPPRLSFAQERLWVLTQFTGPSATYNVAVAYELHGALNADALRDSLTALVRRHESLRTVFAVREGVPVQIIQPPAMILLPVVSLESLAPTEQAEAVRHRMAEEALQPFDLERGPMLRTSLLRLGNEAHVMLLVTHHIATDGWSMRVLLEEVSALYSSRLEGRVPELPPLALQYADFAEWQRSQLQGDRLTRLLDYWREQLSDAPNVLDLPMADIPNVQRSAGQASCAPDPVRVRPAARRFAGAVVRLRLPGELRDRLQKLSQEGGATLLVTLLSAWAIVLSRYSGRSDLLMGVPAANRTHGALDPLIGCFVNVLVVRIRLDKNPPFRAVMAEVRRTLLDAQEHQDLPFERLLELLRPERSRDRNPLVQVMINVHQGQVPLPSFHGLTVAPVDIQEVSAKFDLSLDWVSSKEGLTGELIYDEDVFAADSMERMAGHLRVVLEAIAAHPDERIDALPLLTPAERHELLLGWNDTRVDYPTDRLVHQLFEAQAAERQDALAVRGPAIESLSYHELNERANQLAHYLRAEGVGPRGIVGLCVDRSPEMVVGALSVLKAGGAYLPLDPAYPAERLTTMLADAGAAVVLTQRRWAELFDPRSLKILCLDTEWSDIALQPTTNPASAVGAHHLAYIIYTSGSTGRPKGVAVSHGALLNLVFWHRRAFAVTGADRATQIAGPAFDASVWEVWPYLTAGASLHLIDRESMSSAELLRDWLIAQRITISFLPTPLLESVLSLDWPADTPARLLLTGGDRLREAPRAPLPFILQNNYGPTENTVVSTSGPVGTAGGAPIAPAIGRPIDNVEVYILDHRLEPVPVGVPGELYTGGASLARGYLNRPGLTAERFIPNPFSSSSSGARLYRTGDRARYRADGSIEFLGRTDDQVKIRGVRVELGEIEATLLRHPSVREAVVLAREAPSRSSEMRLVAYVALRGVAFDVGTLRAFLAEKLPDTMIPTDFVVMAALPLTPNGKIDRANLPVPEARRGVSPERPEAPRTEIERALATIWSELLGVEEVGVEDDFFDLGGHSLLAMQVILQVHRKLAVDLTLDVAFEISTLGRLARHIESLRDPRTRSPDPRGLRDPRTRSPDPRGLRDPRTRSPDPRELRAASQADDVPPKPDIVPHLGSVEAPLSFGQERLWRSCQRPEQRALHNIPFALQLQGALDREALRRSLDEIVRRHEILRTRFRSSPEGPVQIVQPFQEVPWIDVDLLAQPEAAREAEVQRLLQGEALFEFDLERDTLLRACLLRVQPGEHLFVLTLHHIITDGWSMGVLLQELSVLYSAYAARQPSPWPPLVHQYQSFAIWQRAWCRHPAAQAHLDYWKTQLSGAPPLLDLPADRARPKVRTFRGAVHTSMLSSEHLKALKRLGAEEHVTLFMLLIAAFVGMLARYSGQRDLVIGTPIANRERAELAPLVGFIANLLALRVQVSPRTSFRALLKDVQQVILDAYRHQATPFELIVEELSAPESSRYAPLFQVTFALQEAFWEHLELLEVTARPLDPALLFAKFDLSVEAIETHEGLCCYWIYSTDLFDKGTIERAASDYQAILTDILRDPDGILL